MMPHNLDWEEGYRAGIERCMTAMMLNTADRRRLWYHLARLHEESADRTDRMLDRLWIMEE